LTTADFDDRSFKAYPNPVKDVLEVSAKQNIKNLEIYNLIGQQVMTVPSDGDHVKVDLRLLSQGTYIVKVTTQDRIKTLKVIKE
jgi:hypothetical protein